MYLFGSNFEFKFDLVIGSKRALQFQILIECRSSKLPVTPQIYRVTPIKMNMVQTTFFISKYKKKQRYLQL